MQTLLDTRKKAGLVRVVAPYAIKRYTEIIRVISGMHGATAREICEQLMRERGKPTLPTRASTRIINALRFMQEYGLIERLSVMRRLPTGGRPAVQYAVTRLGTQWAAQY